MILPQVSEGMASAVAVAAKDCYRGKDKVMKGEEGQERHKDMGESDLESEYAGLFFFFMPVFYNIGEGRSSKNKEGRLKKAKVRNRKNNKKQSCD